MTDTVPGQYSRIRQVARHGCEIRAASMEKL